MTNPYAAFSDFQFWRRGVSRVEPHLFDPVVAPRFRIGIEDKVATAGSCFAQHISRRLSAIGFNYFVVEDGEKLSSETRTRGNYGVFSARFGNIYTVAQLLQLFLEAFGLQIPGEVCWVRPDGRFVDAQRPAIDPDGFATAEEVAVDRRKHLAAVRRMFEECDVFVFTLGLTEAWRSRRDGTVFPQAPGVIAGAFDPELYEPVNFSVGQVEATFGEVLQRLKAVNPCVRVMLTVSPVPLMATFEHQHVLCSTTYSKSILRVVAEQAKQRFNWVEYFPSYEIITGSNSGGRYYEDDYREVNHLGVAHAMRCFLKNYADRPDQAAAEAELCTLELPGAHGRLAGNIVCDEEMLDAVRA